MLNAISEFISSGANLFLCMVLLPVISGGLLWLFRKQYILQLVTGLLAAVLNLVFALGSYAHGEFMSEIPYAPFGFSYSFRVYELSWFFLVFMAVIFLLLVWYTIVNLKKADYSGLYLFYLFLSFAMVNGAMLSDNLGMMLLFWEGLLGTLFGILLIGNSKKPGTAFKAAATQGVAVLLLMLGIIITAHMAETSNMSEIKKLPLTGVFLLGFIMMMLGTFGKCSLMPFHSWTVNAAEDAPTVFMAALPGALDKILGVYFAIRIVTDLYEFVPGGSMSIVLMVMGTISMIFAGTMALVQKDMKRLLAYSAASQMGIMIFAIGTGLSTGILGGLFYLMGYVISMTGLFMISGRIEILDKTTDLSQLGGLRKKMPVTMVCFILFSLSVVGFPGTIGFWTSELVLRAAQKTNSIFFIAVILGILLMALSYLRMGHVLFFEEPKRLQNEKERKREKNRNTREPQDGMLTVISTLSVACLAIGVYPKPWNEVLGSAVGITEHLMVSPDFAMIALVLVFVPLLAAVGHRYGFKKTGNAISATDYIRQAPLLKLIYHWAEKGWLDPYCWMMAMVGFFSDLCLGLEHCVSWIYDAAVPWLMKKAGNLLRDYDNGSLPRYLSLAVMGVAFIIIIFVIVLF